MIRFNDFTLDLVCPSTIISEASCHHTDVTLGHRYSLAVVQRFNCGKSVQVLLDQDREPVEVFPFLLGGGISPFSFKGFPCCGYRDVDVLLGRFMHGHNGLFVGGIDDFERLAVNTLDELIVDESVKDIVISSTHITGRMDVRSRRTKSPFSGMGSTAKTRRSNKSWLTYNPVGCSYLPVTGVSRCSKTDMIDDSNGYIAIKSIRESSYPNCRGESD